MILSRPQIAAFERAIATSNNVLPKIEMLEELARSNPALAERAKELRTKREFIKQLAESALQFNSSLSRAGSS